MQVRFYALLFLRVLFYSLFLLGLSQIFIHDATSSSDPLNIDKFTESSFTEYGQQTILLFVVLINLFVYFQRKSKVTIGLATFFCLAFIREFDAYLT